MGSDISEVTKPTYKKQNMHSTRISKFRIHQYKNRIYIQKALIQVLEESFVHSQ